MSDTKDLGMVILVQAALAVTGEPVQTKFQYLPEFETKDFGVLTAVLVPTADNADFTDRSYIRNTFTYHLGILKQLNRGETAREADIDGFNELVFDIREALLLHGWNADDALVKCFVIKSIDRPVVFDYDTAKTQNKFLSVLQLTFEGLS